MCLFSVYLWIYNKFLRFCKTDLRYFWPARPISNDRCLSLPHLGRWDRGNRSIRSPIERTREWSCFWSARDNFSWRFREIHSRLSLEIPGRILEKSKNLDNVTSKITIGRIRRRYQNLWKFLISTQIKRELAPRSRGVRKRFWVFLKGLSMKIWDFAKKMFDFFSWSNF